MAILIISNNEDISTTELVNWLEYYGASYHRINASVQANNKISLRIGNVNDNLVNFYGIDNINIVWHRRDEAVYLKDINHEKTYLPLEVFRQIYNTNSIELKQFKNSILSNLKKTDIIPNLELNPSKLEILKCASMCGLNIPITLVTNNKQELIQFKNEHNKIITKSIYNLLQLKIDGHYYTNYTIEVTSEILYELSDYFFPSLFQVNVEKKIELRIFYLEEVFYTMAMFSQKNEGTSLDFRHYDNENPTRWVPFKLPEDIEKKLMKLMKETNLKTGSIDMIYTKNKEYIFLEVNPVGQYGMTSFPCNYYLDKRIAKHLIEKDNERNY